MQTVQTASKKQTLFMSSRNTIQSVDDNQLLLQRLQARKYSENSIQYNAGMMIFDILYDDSSSLTAPTSTHTQYP